MKTWEAMKALEKGYKIRTASMADGEYIMLNKSGNIVNESGKESWIGSCGDDWELYDERKDVPLVWRVLYKNIMEVENLYHSYTSDNYQCNKCECDDCSFRNLCDFYERLHMELERLNEYYKLDKKHEFEYNK